MVSFPRTSLRSGPPASSIERVNAAHGEAPSSLAGIRDSATCDNPASTLGFVDEVLASHPHDPEALFTRAFVLFKSGRYIEAFDWSKRASAAGCVGAGNLRLLGWGYLYIGDAQEAGRLMRAAVRVDPADGHSHFALGAALQASGRWTESVTAFDEGLDLIGNDRDSLNLAGGAHLELMHFSEAESYFRRAIEADAAHPSSWTNLGIALARQSRNAEALSAFQRGYELDVEPDSAVDTFVNLAVNLCNAGETQRGADLYRKHLEKTQSIAGFSNFGLTQLAAGNLREGWHYNEFRWLREPLLSMRAPYQRPTWDGQDLDGKTLLIRGEQGIGDVIQFLRYARFAHSNGARILLRLPPGLDDVAVRIPGIDKVLAADEQQEFDFYVHALSLPRIFGTEMHSIPSSGRYLEADLQRIAKWRPIIKSDKSLNVAVVWAGSPSHVRDNERSIRLDTFKALFDAQGVHFYSVQKGPAADALGSEAFPNVTSLSEKITGFTDTAAIIELVDIIICVDTSVAHLAGAMGKTVWLLNAMPGDWRWHGAGETTPWYPSMRIFRQQSAGGWLDVIGRVKQALADAVADCGTLVLTALAHQQDAPVPLDPIGQAAGVELMGAVAETRFGIVQHIPDGSPTSTAIRWYGDYLNPHLELLGPAIRPKSTVLELGAGVGLHALAISTKVGVDGHLIAFEGDPRLRKLLRQNLASNRIRNVTVLCSHEFANKRPERHTTGPSLPTEAPDIDSLRIETLALIKCGVAIDAAQVLRTAADTLWRLRSVIFAHADNLDATDAIGRTIRDYGYRCWYIESPIFDPSNFNRRIENVFGGAVACAVLGLPEENDTLLDTHGLREIE